MSGATKEDRLGRSVGLGKPQDRSALRAGQFVGHGGCRSVDAAGCVRPREGASGSYFRTYRLRHHPLPRAERQASAEFRLMDSHQHLAILVGGGPAPGINSVLASATIRAVLEGVEVIGIRDGFEWIMKGDTSHVTPLTNQEVSRLHFRRGSHIGICVRTPPRTRSASRMRSSPCCDSASPSSSRSAETTRRTAR